MTDYTQLTARELRLKWAEIIGHPMPPIGRSLIIKYLLWYEQAKRERISPLGFLGRWCTKKSPSGKMPNGDLCYKLKTKIRWM